MPADQALKLLLVEDSEADALLIGRHLDRNDLLCTLHRIDEAGGLKELLQDDWSVVLYDYTVPGMNFAGTLALIREQKPDVPVILVSGTITERMAVDLLEYGLDDFVLKDNLVRLPSVIRRVLQRSEEQRQLRLAEDQLRKLAMAVEQSPASIVVTDTTPLIEYVNAAFVANTGYSREEAIGANPSLLNQGPTPPETYTEMWDRLGAGEIWRGEFHNTRKNGSVFVESAVIAPVRQIDGRITNYVAVKTDITENRRSENLIRQLSNFDPLTGLANRRLLLETLAQAVQSSSRSRDHGVVLVLDVDGFKFINDLHGYAVGDAILQSIAQRLSENVTDRSTIARIGANRFAVVVEGLSRKRDTAIRQAQGLAERVHATLQNAHVVPDVYPSIRHATTMGLYLLGHEDDSADRVLSKAEIALERARDEARNTWRFFNLEMQAVVEARALLEAGLHQALENSEQHLVYQSQFDDQGQVTGAEALIRWQRGDGQTVSPDEFIPLAEETGLILPIGAWVIEMACKTLRQWAQSPATAHLHLSINISARQFHQPHFVDSLRKILNDHRIEPDRLVMELTETVVLNDLEQTEQRMRVLRELGVGLAMDDFGTGFSSLAYLKYLPFDTLKIDRSFVSDMIGTASSAAIVKATIAMGHALGLRVIAEAVETREELALLKQYGCDAFQGFLFARPLDPERWQPESWQPESWQAPY